MFAVLIEICMHTVKVQTYKEGIELINDIFMSLLSKETLKIHFSLKVQPFFRIFIEKRNID